MSRSSWSVLRAASALALTGMLASPGCAAADGATDKPSLSLTDAEDLELVVSANHQGALRVTLINPGPGAVTPTFALVREGTTGSCGKAFQQTSETGSGPISAGDHNTVDLTFAVSDDCVGTEATLLVGGDPAIKTVTGSVTAVREITARDYMPPLVVAAVLGLMFLVISMALLRNRLGRRTASGSSWSFAGSWLTSISGVSTALAGILAASGFVDEALPGVPLGHFLGLSLTFGILVLAAPMAFSIFQITEWEKGTPTETDKTPDPIQVVNGRLVGVLVAGSLTCAGVGGQLAMLAVLTDMSRVGGGSKNTVLALLAASLVLLAAYVIFSTRQASALSRPRSDRAPSAEETAAIAPAAQAVHPGFTGTF